MKNYPLIVIGGPTATGKTKLAARLSAIINAEIISADSRQVYKEMNIGTGKDYEDYIVNEVAIPYHLIDIAEPGYEYSVYEFQRDFKKCVTQLKEQNKNVVLCGGTGFYIEAALGLRQYIQVSENSELRKELASFSLQELINKLENLKPLHNTTDITSKERLVRAIEIEMLKNTPSKCLSYSKEQYVFFLIDLPREEIKKRIEHRLYQRLNNGMIEEVQQLLEKGVGLEKMKYYGLEYKYISLYLHKEISYSQMQEKLFIAISQFAKRQRTWFRRMEKQGVEMHRINGLQTEKEKIETLLKTISRYEL